MKARADDLESKRLYHIPWPASLKRLRLQGYTLALGLLYEFPPLLDMLDISSCELQPHTANFGACLPHLRLLIADYAKLPTFRSPRSHTDRRPPPGLWSLPSGLQGLHLTACAVGNRWDLLAFLPASITHLNLSCTDLAEDQCSLEAQGWSDPFMNTICQRLPKLQYLNLWYHQQNYYYLICRMPRFLEFSPSTRFKVVRTFISPRNQKPQHIVPPGPVGAREEDPNWCEFVANCATERAAIVFAPIPPEVVPDDDEPLDDDDDDDEEGGLLFGL